VEFPLSQSGFSPLAEWNFPFPTPLWNFTGVSWWKFPLYLRGPGMLQKSRRLRWIFRNFVMVENPRIGGNSTTTRGFGLTIIFHRAPARSPARSQKGLQRSQKVYRGCQRSPARVQGVSSEVAIGRQRSSARSSKAVREVARSCQRDRQRSERSSEVVTEVVRGRQRGCQRLSLRSSDVIRGRR
jgi:hypothetical protein